MALTMNWKALREYQQTYTTPGERAKEQREKEKQRQKIKVRMKPKGRKQKKVRNPPLRYTVVQGIEPSPREAEIMKLLDSMKLNYVREVEFSGCINPKTGYYFRFDFYLPSKNLVIEYDGAHHRTDEYFKWADDLKNQFLQKYRIRLIRINSTNFRNARQMIKART